MVKSLLSSQNWLPYFKPLAQAFGDNDPAILLSELANLHEYYSSNCLLTEDGYFFCTAEMLERAICLTPYKQAQALSKLEVQGLIQTKLAGMPAKKHFRFPDGFENLFSNFLKSSFQKTSKQVLKKFENTYIEQSIRIDDEKYIVVSGETTLPSEHILTLKEREMFTPQTPQSAEPSPKPEPTAKLPKPELLKQAGDVLAHLNEKAMREFPLAGKRADSNLKIIAARLKDGYTVGELKQVIEVKVAKWLGDPEMKGYLQPSTLFRPSHVGNYLQEAKDAGAQAKAPAPGQIAFDVSLNGSEEAYRQLFENLKQHHPNVAAEVRFFAASEFLSFTHQNPTWFPNLNTHFSKSLKKKVIAEALGDLEADPKRRQTAGGGLFAYLTAALNKKADD